MTTDHFTKNYHRYLLFIIFLLALALRLYFAFQSPDNFDYSSYFEMRQVEHIRQNWLPLIHDDLSYSGRTILSTPLYYYLLAVFNLFLPLTLVCKIIPNVILSLLVIVVYLISFHLTKNRNMSLLTAFISTLIPIFFSSSVFTLSAEPVALLLVFFSLYCFMRMNESEKYVNLFLVVMIILPLFHGSSLLLVVGLLFYLFLTKIEGFNPKKQEIEIILFSTFFITWTLFLIFKKAILIHGPMIIWRNLPESILDSIFASTDILKYIYYIGIVPLILGVWSVSRQVFKQKNISSYVLISFSLSIFLLLLFRLVDPVLGVSYIGIVLVMISSKILVDISEYIDKTKAANYKKQMFAAIVLIFILTSFIATVNLSDDNLKKLPSDEQISFFRMLGDSTAEDDVILSHIDYGHLINSVSHRKNVLDDNFLNIKDPEDIMADVKEIYQSNMEIEAIRLINKYAIKYILLTPKEKEEYGIIDLSYRNDLSCFETVYDRDNIKLYKFLGCKTA